MCRGPEDTKAERPFRKPAIRPIEELTKDFQQRPRPVEAATAAAQKQAESHQEAEPRGRAAGGKFAKPETRMPAKTQLPSKVEATKNTTDAPKPALRSLEDLQRDFLRRRGARPVQERKSPPAQTGILRKVVEGKGFGFIVPDGGSKDVLLHFSDLLHGGPEDMVAGMRVSYTGEVDPKSGKTRARNAAFLAGGARKGADAPQSITAKSSSGKNGEEAKAVETAGRRAEAPPQEPPLPCCYVRELLLAAARQSQEAREDRAAALPIVAVPVARDGEAAAAARRPPRGRGGRYAEDPSLDDEDLLGKLEDRLSRESGADAKNSETFGDCSKGWTFEEALEANSKLLACGITALPSASTGSFFVLQDPGDAMPPWTARVMVSTEYSEVASQLVKEPEHCLSTVPSSEDFEQCLSTAASSGASTPPGPARLTKEQKEALAPVSKDQWIATPMVFQ